MGKSTYTLACAGLLGIAVLVSAGCINRRVAHDTTGVHVNTQAFNQIVEGKTSAAWVQGVMGKPTSTQKGDENTEVWTWTGSDQKTVKAQYLIVTDRSMVTEHTTASVEVKNGIVTRKWIGGYTVKNQEDIN